MFKFLKVVLFGALLALGTMPVLGSSEPAAYNDAWWGSAPHDERVEFIAGYIDCAVYDQGDTQLAGVQWNVIEPEITRFYASHSKATNQTVPSLILSLGVKSHSNDHTSEQHSEKHGIFDGDYWRQITQLGRIGFVEGYLDCRRSKSQSPQFAAHSTAWYVSQIGNAYALTKEDDIDDNRASEKIATIIQKLVK
jgi:hypothetical protein